ncbi:MAG TPA: hypothetical protein ENI33_09550 [Thermoplasmatales archaeon]|nr:hypothetical protein [Thermoplasmatales archaeon]
MLAVLLGIFGFIFGFNYGANRLHEFLSNELNWLILLLLTIGVIAEIAFTIYYYLKYVELRNKLEKGEI